jgi:hypothetical protein
MQADFRTAPFSCPIFACELATNAGDPKDLALAVVETENEATSKKGSEAELAKRSSSTRGCWRFGAPGQPWPKRALGQSGVRESPGKRSATPWGAWPSRLGFRHHGFDRPSDESTPSIRTIDLRGALRGGEVGLAELASRVRSWDIAGAAIADGRVFQSCSRLRFCPGGTVPPDEPNK